MKDNQTNSIPKVIHYCWFGKKPIPYILKYCIDSWKKQLPDYEFFLWNEDNIKFDCEFIAKAYSDKKWAFVSDYVRLKMIYEHGGIYLDTDMLLLKPLDEFLENECFFVAEHPKSIGVGIFGAKKNNIFIKDCLQYYTNFKSKNEKTIPIPKIVTDAFEERYKLRNIFLENIIVDGLTVYEADYFYSLPYTKLFDIHNYKNYLKENSYGVHLWFGSWHSYNELYLLRRKEYFKALKKIGRSLFLEKKFSFLYFKKLVIAFRDSLKYKNAFK